MAVAGEPVTSLCEHKGLIRGVVVAGSRQDIRERAFADQGRLPL